MAAAHVKGLNATLRELYTVDKLKGKTVAAYPPASKSPLETDCDNKLGNIPKNGSELGFHRVVVDKDNLAVGSQSTNRRDVVQVVGFR